MRDADFNGRAALEKSHPHERTNEPPWVWRIPRWDRTRTGGCGYQVELAADD